MAIWSKRITEQAAFWGMLSGLVCNVVPKLFEFIGMIDLPSYLDPVLIGGVVSLVVTIVVSRRTTVSSEEASYLRMLHKRPVDEIGVRRTRTTLLMPVLLLLTGTVTPYLLVQYYVRPFQRATGTLLADGSLNLASGEMVLIYCWVGLWVSLAAFTAWYVRRSYAPASSPQEA
jgi:sodium/pantothenate symporter